MQQNQYPTRRGFLSSCIGGLGIAYVLTRGGMPFEHGLRSFFAPATSSPSQMKNPSVPNDLEQ